LKKAQGARVEIIFADGRRLVDEIAVANSHPYGEKPFGRPQYVGKFRKLVDRIASNSETDRFLGAVGRLAALDAAGLRALNPVADAAALKCAERDGRGIF
ncbi:MAG TPA: MmgE/PrpD family protein, partial [Alphaproteobacteria bacterium]